MVLFVCTYLQHCKRWEASRSSAGACSRKVGRRAEMESRHAVNRSAGGAAVAFPREITLRLKSDIYQESLKVGWDSDRLR